VVRVEGRVEAVYPCAAFGECGGIPVESDSSDPDEIGRVKGGGPILEARLFISDKDPMGRRVANDGTRDKGMGGRLLSRSHGVTAVL
jgi:hypothetical protein